MAMSQARAGGDFPLRQQNEDISKNFPSICSSEFPLDLHLNIFCKHCTVTVSG